MCCIVERTCVMQHKRDVGWSGVVGYFGLWILQDFLYLSTT